MLLNACWDAADELQINTVFTLTYVAEFFEKQGYHRIDKADLPHKIWNECVRCPLFPNCNEIALIRSFHPEQATIGAAAEAGAGMVLLTVDG
jgi:amino-acid N-acetyltransferase